MDQIPPKEGRSAVNLRIKFRSESLEQFIERYAVDVSRGGIFIRTREPLAVGTQLKLDFQYQSGGALMAGDGTVVWIREPDPARPNIPPGMGVRFDRLTPESQVVLELLLADKVKRDKSAMSPPAGMAGGGVAVRRPSSMFAALEPPSSGAKTTPAIAFPTAAPPVASRTVGPPPRVGAVTSILIVPIEGKATPTGTSAPAPAAAPLARTEAPRRPEAAAATEAAPAASAAPVASEGAAGGYRPLGTARNPFSGARPTPTPLARPVVSPAPAAGRLGESTRDTARSVETNAADDDMNEEPTQIAGRIPAFLLSEEDPTSVGTNVSEGDQALRSAEPAPGVARLTARSSEAQAPSDASSGKSAASTEEPGRSPIRPAIADRASGSLGAASSVRASGPLRALASDLSKPRQSLDLAPPLGDGEPAAPASGPEHGLDTSPELPATPSDKTAVPRPTRNLDALSLAVATPEARSAPPTKNRSGALVAGLVAVLGATAFFAFRFFASQHASSPPPAAPMPVAAAEPTAAVPAQAAAAPAPTTGAAPKVEAPAAPAAKEPPAATAQKAEGTPTPVGGAETVPAAAAPAAAAAAPAAAAPAPTAPAGPAEPAKEAAPKSEPSKPIAAAEPAASSARKPAHKRIGRVGHEGDATAVSAKPPAAPAAGSKSPVPESPSEAPPPATAKPASDKTAGDARPDLGAQDHQLRVTSKPPGADVTIDGQVVGQTPLSTGIPDVSAPHFVSVHKDGFEPFEQMISASSAWVKGRPVKGQQAIPTLKLNAKLKAIGGAGDAKPASGEAAPAKDAPGPKAEEPRQDRALPPSSDDRLPPSTP